MYGWHWAYQWENQTVVGPRTRHTAKISKFTGVTNTHYIIHSDKQNFSINLHILIVWNENFSVSSLPVQEISLYYFHPQFRFIAWHSALYFPFESSFTPTILHVRDYVTLWRCYSTSSNTVSGGRELSSCYFEHILLCVSKLNSAIFRELQNNCSHDFHGLMSGV